MIVLFCFLNSHIIPKRGYIWEWSSKIFYSTNSTPIVLNVLALVHEYWGWHLALSENFPKTEPRMKYNVKYQQNHSNISIAERRWYWRDRGGIRTVGLPVRSWRKKKISYFFFFTNLLNLFIYFEIFYLIFPDLRHFPISFQNFLL